MSGHWYVRTGGLVYDGSDQSLGTDDWQLSQATRIDLDFYLNPETRQFFARCLQTGFARVP